MTIKQKCTHWFAALAFVTGVGGTALVVAAPQPAAAVCSESLLTFPAWYKGLLEDANADKCDIKSPGDSKESLTKFVWTIALNVISMALNLIGYLAVGYIIYGGYKYMISAGAPDGMVKARKTILNAVIGLLISIFSIAIVNVIAGAIR